MGEKKVEWLVSLVFFIVGGIFFILSVSMIFYGINFRNNAVARVAIITDIDSHGDSDSNTQHTVYVKYKVDGLEYNESLGYYSTGMSVGQEIPIYYKPESPNRIMADSSILLWLIFFILGLILLSVAFIITFIKIKKKRRHKELMASGRKIYADITEITKNFSYTVNGRSPFLIVCKWVDPSTGLFYFFRSENIWFNPQPILEEKGIKSLAVYIDRESPKKYAVSLEEVEKFLGSV